MASTIRTYKAALSTYHEEHSSGPNPLKSDRVSRLIAGIEAAKAQKEADRRRARPKTAGVTMDMVRSLASKYAGGSDRQVMLLAIVALATAAALRPSEVLGTERRERALLAVQIRFFASAASTEPITHFEPLEGGAQPDRACATLLVSKTNQRHESEEVYVAAPVAVRALWAWRLRRHSPAHDALYGPEFFRIPGYRPPRVPRVLAFVKDGLAELGYGRLHITGKAFRIGGTSTLAALNAPEADLSALGRWRSASMWRTYADPASRAQRAIATSRRM